MISAAARLTAQVEDDPVLVPVQFAVTTGLMGQGGTSSAGFNVNGYGNVVTVSTPQTAQFAVTASLAPGKSYTMTLTCSNVYYSFNVYMAAPTGYRLTIESVERYGLI